MGMEQRTARASGEAAGGGKEGPRWGWTWPNRREKNAPPEQSIGNSKEITTAAPESNK